MKTREARSPGLTLSVREAKNRLSELVRRVANGEEILITSHGEVRARLGAVQRASRPLAVDRKWLREMKVQVPQTPSEVVIRCERDQRD